MSVGALEPRSPRIDSSIGPLSQRLSGLRSRLKNVGFLGNQFWFSYRLLHLVLSIYNCILEYH